MPERRELSEARQGRPTRTRSAHANNANRPPARGCGGRLGRHPQQGRERRGWPATRRDGLASSCASAQASCRHGTRRGRSREPPSSARRRHEGCRPIHACSPYDRRRRSRWNASRRDRGRAWLSARDPAFGPNRRREPSRRDAAIVLINSPEVLPTSWACNSSNTTDSPGLSTMLYAPEANAPPTRSAGSSAHSRVSCTRSSETENHSTRSSTSRLSSDAV